MNTQFEDAASSKRESKNNRMLRLGSMEEEEHGNEYRTRTGKNPVVSQQRHKKKTTISGAKKPVYHRREGDTTRAESQPKMLRKLPMPEHTPFNGRQNARYKQNSHRLSLSKRIEWNVRLLECYVAHADIPFIRSWP